jgi:hypothetical protein
MEAEKERKIILEKTQIEYEKVAEEKEKLAVALETAEKAAADTKTAAEEARFKQDEAKAFVEETAVEEKRNEELWAAPIAEANETPQKPIEEAKAKTPIDDAVLSTLGFVSADAKVEMAADEEEAAEPTADEEVEPKAEEKAAEPKAEEEVAEPKAE